MLNAETPLKGKGGVPGRGWEAWRNWPLLAARSEHSDAVVDEMEEENIANSSRQLPPKMHGSSSSHRRRPRQRDDGDMGNVSGGSSGSFVAPPPTLYQHLCSEISWGHALSPRGLALPAEHMLNFLRVTFALEPFLSFGHALCVDLFLFHFTLLPVRCVAALWVAIGSWCGMRREKSGLVFTNAHAYDLIKGALLVAAATALGFVQVSRVYHYIRGEAIIKLYVIFNILEIFDKLACSLGQDVMDGLYRTTRDHLELDASPVKRRRALLLLSFHFAVAVAYVVAHALILFVQIVCLNVAINSRNNALFTLLISNNFMELKASVFKKFEAENLFQVACSDAVERFQLGLFLVLIGVQELRSSAAVTALLPPMVAIYLCEVRNAMSMKHGGNDDE